MKTKNVDVNEVWENTPYIEFPDPKAPCQYANEFQGWASSHVEEAQHSSTTFLINEKMLLITKKYREYMRHIPEDHHIQARKTGHKCIYAIWAECCKALEESELKLTPQLPEKPTPPIPPIDKGPSSSDIGASFD